MIRIRPAAVADAETLARLHVASWREAYAGILPAAHLDRLSIRERTGLWHRVLTGGAGWALVAETPEAGAVGFVSGGRLRDGGAGRTDGEVAAVHVLGAWQGRGLGRRLLAAAVTRLAADGHTRLFIWTLADNRPARVFYEHLGGHVDAEEVDDVDGHPVREVRYRWDRLPAL